MPRGTARDTLCHPAHHPEAMATRAITPAMGRGRRQAVVLQAQLRSERVWAAAVQHGSWRAATTASREKSLASVSRSATGGALRARHCGRTAETMQCMWSILKKRIMSNLQRLLPD